MGSAEAHGVYLAPGYDERLAGDVEVRFAAVGDSTRVELTHRGFEKCGAEAAAIRDGYETGWGYVLGDRYAPYAAQNRTGWLSCGATTHGRSFVRSTTRSGAHARAR